MFKLGYGVGMADSRQQQSEAEMGDFPKASEAPILVECVASPGQRAAQSAETSSAGPLPAETVPEPAREEPPVAWRELLAIAAMVALADVAIYRGHGFAGYAALFLGAPALLLFGAPQPRFSAGLWAVGLFVYLYGLTPVDYLAHQYNVRRIMAGDSAPSVQISVHPIDSEGILSLLPLVDCPDPIVRAGVLAMLADRRDEAERLAKDRKIKGWTTCQFGDQLLLEQLRLHQSKWVQYVDRAARSRAREQFNQYAYRWY